MTLVDEKKNKLEILVKSCRLIQRMNRARPDVMKSEVLYYQLLTNYFTNILNARNEGKPMALYTVFVPAEIFYAMDIVPMHAETTSWMIAAFAGDIGTLLSKAAELGLATEICSAHRGLAGAYALEVMPRPDAVVWSSLTCDNTAKSGELLIEMNHCKGFFIDHPFKETKEELDYLAGELKELVAFLEDLTGRKMDWDRLSQQVARTNRQIELYREIHNLRKAVPSPFPMHRFMEFIMSMYLMPGHPDALVYLETLRDELAVMVKEGKGAVSPERFRLMSLWVPPVFLMGMLGEVSKEFGVVSVVEPLFNLWRGGQLDPSKPLESLARKSFMFPELASYGPLDERILKRTGECARDYKVDGAIFYAHVGCRQGSALVKTYKDLLAEVDIPMLTVDFDLLDQTVTPPEQIRGKMRDFFELLEDR